ncbi:hypothetical protein FTO70_15030 [Methanosarcina sp. KYL-1]|nr:hypothetical protein [Methanosarcina sp. KYL-1]
MIEHWIEHNESHNKSFVEWAQKAKKDGFLDAAEEILEASKKVDEANEHLRKAKEGLFHLD